jgi:alpha-beta hydrolase superfamily lysophospholipase
LYLHGYVDYFFHPHLGEKFNQNNFDFHALDLRKHGRSLLEHQHPNYCKEIEEYFEEITIAIRDIKEKSSSVYILAHSTGGLTASLYMNKGEERGLVDALILNSPFLDFNMSKLQKSMTLFLAKIISKTSNYAKVEGVLSKAYAESIHKDYFGEWDFDLKWKPIKGFPTYFKWIRAISNAQAKLQNSNIEVPVLVMHSSGSKKMSKFSKAAKTNDIVLNVDDIKRVGAKLGDNVTLSQIDNAVHDIFLSSKSVREVGFEKMFNWLAKLES